MPIRLLIGCKVFLFAEGLRLLLQDCEGLDVAGVTSSRGGLEELMSKRKPDIVILDDFFFQDVLDNTVKIENGSRKILLITENGSGSFIFEDLQGMVAQGLVGMLPHDADPEQMKKAIRKVYLGELWIAHDTIRNSLVNHARKKKNIVLTKREKEVLYYLSFGYSNKRIAQELFISEQTVKSHFNRLFKKFQVPNRLQLAMSISEINLQ